MIICALSYPHGCTTTISRRAIFSRHGGALRIVRSEKQKLLSPTVIWTSSWTTTTILEKHPLTQTIREMSSPFTPRSIPGRVCNPHTDTQRLLRGSDHSWRSPLTTLSAISLSLWSIDHDDRCHVLPGARCQSASSISLLTGQFHLQSHEQNARTRIVGHTGFESKHIDYRASTLASTNCPLYRHTFLFRWEASLKYACMAPQMADHTYL